MGSCWRLLGAEMGRGSPVAFSCESSRISAGATCTRLFALSCPLGTPLTKIEPSSVVEYDSDGPVEGKIPRAPFSNWRWEVASRTRCKHTCCSTWAGRTRAPGPLCAGPLPRSLGMKGCPSAWGLGPSGSPLVKRTNAVVECQGVKGRDGQGTDVKTETEGENERLAYGVPIICF